MPALVTENWDATKYKRNDSAYKEYLVTGVANEHEAVQAVPYQKDSTHNFDSRLYAEEPEIVERPGPLTFVVGVNFSIPSPASQPGISPVDTRPRIKWFPTVEAGPTDIDAVGNAIRNAAGDLPSSLPIGFMAYGTLEFRRVESSYDPSFALGFMNTINADSFSMYIGQNQRRNVGNGQCCLRFYGPEEEFIFTDPNNTQTPFFWAKYIFELRPYAPGTESISNQDYKSAFQIHFTNAGKRGWYDDSGTVKQGPITESGIEVTEDVLLNDRGIPVDTTTYKVKDKTPVANPNTIHGAQFYQGDGQSSWNVVFRRCIARPFSALGI